MSTGATYRRDLDAIARRFGCAVARTRGDHLRVSHPDGWFTICPMTPRRPFDALRLAERHLKRARVAHDAGSRRAAKGYGR